MSNLNSNTMDNKTYNGWFNYATWRINLEIFDGFDAEDQYGIDSDCDAYDLGQHLKDYAESIIEIDVPSKSLALSYAHAFMQDVNWSEIAQHMIDEMEDNDWLIKENEE